MQQWFVPLLPYRIDRLFHVPTIWQAIKTGLKVGTYWNVIFVFYFKQTHLCWIDKKSPAQKEPGYVFSKNRLVSELHVHAHFYNPHFLSDVGSKVSTIFGGVWARTGAT
jgi:hypothetical protein